MHGGLICIALSVCDWTKIQTGQKVIGLQFEILLTTWVGIKLCPSIVTDYTLRKIHISKWLWCYCCDR